MNLNKHVSSLLQLALILALLLAACSRSSDLTPTVGDGYPAPGEQTNPYPDPLVSSDQEISPGLNPDIYPPPGQATMFDPAEGDNDMDRHDVTLVADSVQIFVDEAPVIYVRLTIEVADLCQLARVRVNPPRDGKINLQVYSVSEKGKDCAQIVNTVIPTVTLGSLEAGSYELLFNGEVVGTFEVK